MFLLLCVPQSNGSGAAESAAVDKSGGQGQKKTRGFPRVIHAGHGIKLGAVVSLPHFTHPTTGISKNSLMPPCFRFNIILCGGKCYIYHYKLPTNTTYQGVSKSLPQILSSLCFHIQYRRSSEQGTLCTVLCGENATCTITNAYQSI